MKKWLSILCFCLMSIAFAAKDQTVTVEGLSSGKKPVAEARAEALHNACVLAVEKNLGTWLKSQSSSASFTSSSEYSQAKNEILSNVDEFIVDTKILRQYQGTTGYRVQASVTVSVDRLSGEIRKYVGAVKNKMDNPTIAFVLTSWEKKGVFSTVTQNGSVSRKDSYNGAAQAESYDYSDSERSGSNNYSGSASYAASRNASASATASGSARMDAHVSEDGEYASGSYDASGSYSGSARGSASVSAQANASYASNSRNASRNSAGMAVNSRSESNSQIDASMTTGKIDETVYAKFADMGIIDGFQQEFKEKGFDLKAADKAREIAVAPSALQTGININDRSAVRNFAEKEGANYVARGEVMLLGKSTSAATGQPEVTAKIGTEIIDVGSGDVVASYSNTVTVSNSNVDKAKAQVIKKAAVVAARTLASQTLQTWQERAETGRQYVIEVRNIKKARSQKMPFEKALKAIAKITSQTSPSSGVQTYQVLFKGNKSDLEEAILEAIGDAKGFSEDEFDGPNDQDGKIVFTFTK